MASKHMKIRISLINQEIELEGDLDVIKENFGEHIEEFLQKAKKNTGLSKAQHPSDVKTNLPQVRQANEGAVHPDKVPDSFGEFYSKFPRNLSNVDKILLAGYYLQNQNEGRCFTVKEAADLLLDQGVNLSNAGAFNNSNVSTKRAFKLSGKNFRVSDIGAEYIKTLPRT